MAVTRVLWDEQECAILMDYFMRYRNGEITKEDAISNVSKELRERAKKKGIEIDDVFRNVNGITMQMSKIADLYFERTPRLSKAPPVFVSIVDKYLNNRPSFDRILKEARSMEKSAPSLALNNESVVSVGDFVTLYSLTNQDILEIEIGDYYAPHLEEVCLGLNLGTIFDCAGERFRVQFIQKHAKAKKMTSDYKSTDMAAKSNQIQTVIFGSLDSYAYTCPKQLVYFGEKYTVNNWSRLYVQTVRCLYYDYPEMIKSLLGANIGQRGRIDIADDSLVSQMAAPKRIIDGYYLETNLSATNIVLKIKQLLDFCRIDYENVVITYLQKKSKVLNREEPGSPVPIITRKVSASTDSKAFLRWMLDEQHMAISSCRSYSSGINNCEQLAVQLGLESTQLYGVNFEEVQRTAQLLMENANFRENKDSRYNRLRASLTKYLQYLSGDTSLSLNQITTSIASQPKPTEDLLPYDHVLQDNFSKGYRVNSNLDLKRFVRCLNDEYGTDLDFSDEVVRSRTKQNILHVGIRHEDYIFSVESLVNPETKEHLISYIKDNFSQGKKVIYYKAMFETFNDEFLGQCIYNENMLRTYLEHEFGGDYFFERSFLSQERYVRIDATEEIREILITHGAPMKTEELYSQLPNLPTNKIDWAIHTNKEFVCNTKGEYFSVSLIDLTDNELEDIAIIIEHTIEESHFISGNELIQAIRSKYPDMLDRFPQFSQLGLRDSIAYYLRDRFSFNRNIISSLHKQLSLNEVFVDFVRTHHSFTIDELNVLKKELNTIIYFDLIYANSLRISQRQFVSKDEANFDVINTDKAISSFCVGDYLSLSGVTSFGAFPDADFPWNIWLLEHYVADYSNEYKLLHTSFNADNCVGAIVKKSSAIESFNDLITDVLAHSEVNLNKKDALEYLCRMGYLARRRLSDIDQILIAARAKKE